MRSRLSSERRSHQTRTDAEAALVRFALLAGAHAQDFVVIGGLNPDFLAPHAPTPHLGTTDVDLLFELGFVFDREHLNFEWLDEVLERGGFRPRTIAGWQWDGKLVGRPVRLDLLCDVDDSRGQPIVLPGAANATAQNLDGPAAALHDPTERSLTVPTSVLWEFPNAPDAIRLRFASLGGYLASKSAALLARGKVKDAYDLMFVVMYAPGGPAAAARAVADLRLPAHVAPALDVVRSAVAPFTDARSRDVDTVISQLVLAGDGSDPEQLRADVSVSAAQFLDAFS